MATSPLGGFADLSQYTPDKIAARIAAAQANTPLDAAIQGAQQGIALQQLPQQLRDQALQRQLQNALLTQKLQDLQNPQAALLRKLQEELTIKGALNPDLGIQAAPTNLQGEIIGNPGALTLEQQAALTASGVVPTVQAALPETPISAFGLQTGLNLNPNIPLEAQQRKDDAIIRRSRAAMKGMTTKEGYFQNPVTGELTQIFVPGSEADLASERKTTAESAAQAKVDAAQSKNDQANARLEKTQDFTAQENEKNRQSRETLADKRSKLASSTPPVASQYQAERQKRVLDSVADLEQDVGYDTVGFADWFKAVPTTPAKNFAGRLKTLKAAIAFGELTAMREASKTGGALGQVSNIELGLLESALGNLDQAQSPSEFKEELGKIRGSIQRWQKASSTLSPKATSTTGGPVKVGRFEILPPE